MYLFKKYLYFIISYNFLREIDFQTTIWTNIWKSRYRQKVNPDFVESNCRLIKINTFFPKMKRIS